jgi:hypothetical protein
VKINLFADLKKELARNLRQLGCKVPANGSAEDLLESWFDYQMRRISPVPRQVFLAPQFEQNRENLSTDEKGALKSIIGKLERGDDVTAHLSRDILNAAKPDLLMADWRIYHIHISETKKTPKDFFFKRADHLVFAIVTPTSVYLLNIYPHKEKDVWSKSELLKIIKETWPELLKPFHIVGRLEPNSAISEAERQKLRKAGINVPSALGDSIIFPLGGGVNAVGRPTSVSRRARGVYNNLSIIQMYLEEYPEVADGLAHDLGLRSDQLSIKLEWKGGNVYLREETSGKYLAVDMEIAKEGAAAVLRKERLGKGA